MALFIDQVALNIMKSLTQLGGFDNAGDVLDSMSKAMGYGSQVSAYNDYFYGINKLANMAPLPQYKELTGLILFTKPNLNLSYDNIATVRPLAHFLTQDPNTYQYAIRMMLDPTTYGGNSTKKSMLVDPNMPYLSLLTNSLVTMNQPPDIGLNIYSSPEGHAKEVFIMNDGIAESNGRYDLTCTFNNIKGNPGIALFHLWIMYIGYLRTGPIIPHPIQRASDEIDYNTRIEQFKFDESGRFITSWFHTGVSIPTNCSIGAGFGKNIEEGTESNNKQFSVQFTCAGAIYNDPIQLLEFNMRITQWNPKMDPSVRNNHYIKVPYSAKVSTNYRGYPYINLATGEMDWYISKDEYEAVVRTLA